MRECIFGITINHHRGRIPNTVKVTATLPYSVDRPIGPVAFLLLPIIPLDSSVELQTAHVACPNRRRHFARSSSSSTTPAATSDREQLGEWHKNPGICCTVHCRQTQRARNVVAFPSDHLQLHEDDDVDRSVAIAMALPVVRETKKEFISVVYSTDTIN